MEANLQVNLRIENRLPERISVRVENRDGEIVVILEELTTKNGIVIPPGGKGQVG